MPNILINLRQFRLSGPHIITITLPTWTTKIILHVREASKVTIACLGRMGWPIMMSLAKSNLTFIINHLNQICVLEGRKAMDREFQKKRNSFLKLYRTCYISKKTLRSSKLSWLLEKTLTWLMPLAYLMSRARAIFPLLSLEKLFMKWASKQILMRFTSSLKDLILFRMESSSIASFLKHWCLKISITQDYLVQRNSNSFPKQQDGLSIATQCRNTFNYGTWLFKMKRQSKQLGRGYTRNIDLISAVLSKYVTKTETAASLYKR